MGRGTTFSCLEMVQQQKGQNEDISAVSVWKSLGTAGVWTSIDQSQQTIKAYNPAQLYRLEHCSNWHFLAWFHLSVHILGYQFMYFLLRGFNEKPA